MHAHRQAKFLFIYYCISTNPHKAYAALSGMKQWNTSNNLFHVDQFYNNIVRIFEANIRSSWVEETLNWWHK